ncbi:MAG TPA: SRPBCC family protein [Candidatus Aquilonibacter sp.]|jgi:ligand-binding SRPBCC domain-containing protein|nr:SRPBCC family protein [Candidatus Aquilonibacter sp.]
MKAKSGEDSGKIYEFQRTQLVPRPLETVFEFFSRAANLQVLTPPWLEFRLVDAPQELAAGSLIRYKLRVHKVPIRWTTQITEWEPPRRFVDIELSGPYALWLHEHTFTPDPKGTIMRDTVRYALPFGFLGQIANWVMVERDVRTIFDYRTKKMRELFG